MKVEFVSNDKYELERFPVYSVHRDVVRHIHKKFPESTLLAIGFSLGANILVRYLAEEEGTPVKAAVSIGNPFDLEVCNQNFKQGFNKVYDYKLAKALTRIYRQHESLFTGMENKFNLSLARSANTIEDYDDAITTRSFGEQPL